MTQTVTMNLATPLAKASVLIEAMSYIRSFRGATVVIKFGGSAMENPAHMNSVLLDIAFLWTVGICPVVVHGGGKAISRAMERAKISTRFVQGLRVTCEKSIQVVEKVIKEEVNQDIVRRLMELETDAEGLSGEHVFKVRRKTGTDPDTGQVLDWGFVGEPVSCEVERLLEIQSRGAIPVICPLGRGEDGCLYNINADHAAASLAKALQARKLAFVSDIPGLLRNPDDPDSLIDSLKIEDAPALVREGVVGGGMLPKIQSCIDAIRAGVGKVHIVDGRVEHSLLLEIFTKTGVGTEIVG